MSCTVSTELNFDRKDDVHRQNLTVFNILINQLIFPKRKKFSDYTYITYICKIVTFNRTVHKIMRLYYTTLNNLQ